jgi:TP901 family phage tail tape measure protein
MADQINLYLGINNDKAIHGLKETEAQAKKSSNAIQGEFKKLSNASDVFAGVLTSGLALRAFSTLNQAVSNSFREFRNFEKALLEIQTILPKNAKQTDGLARSLANLSASYGTSQTQQAKAFYQIVSAGITETVAATKLLDAANKVALGGLSDVESSVDVLTDILNVYGQENITAADAADTLFQTVKLGKTRIEDLSSSIGSVLPLAKQLNISFTEVSAALAQLTTKGQTTSERVTQLNSLFTSVIRNQDRAKQISKEVADAFNVTALKTKGLNKFLQDLIKATGGSESILQTLIGRTEGVKAVLGLAQDGFVGLNDKLDQFQKRGGAASEAADKVKKSLDFQLTQLTSQFQNLTTALLENEGIFSEIVGTYSSALKAFTKFVDTSETKSQALIRRQSELSEEAQILESKISSLQKRANQGGLLGGLAEGQIESATNRLKFLRQEISLLNKQRSDLRKSGQGTEDSGSAGSSQQTEQERLEAEKRKAILADELATKKALEEDYRLQKQEQTDIDQAEFDVAAEERLSRLADTLGQEEAVRLQAEAIRLKREKKFTEARKKLEQAETKAKQKEVKARTAQVKLEEQVQIASFQATGNLLQALSQLSATQGRKNFQITKGLALAAIPLNTAAAIMNALANIPAPANIIAAAAAGATGAAQLITVAQSKPPAFENGGIVGGSSFTGDNQIARVNSGELILNTAQQENVASTIQQDQPIIIEIDGREVFRTVQDQIEAGAVLGV